MNHAQIHVEYQQKDISPLIFSFAYTDELSGFSDSLSLDIIDKVETAEGKWFPSKSDVLKASLSAFFFGKKVMRPCGVFEIDTYRMSGPPSTLRVEALSIPTSGSLKKEGRFQAWEKATLNKVAKEIAARNKMSLVFEVTETINYDRIEQTGESDIAFLNRLCQQDGLALKVANRKIIIFDEQNFEKKPAKMTISETDGDLTKYDFGTSLNDLYGSARVSYHPPKAKKSISVTFKAPVAKSGRILVVNTQVKTKEEALRAAKKQLRNANKNETTGRLSFIGLKLLYAGDTVSIKGFGKFNGKYIVTRVIVNTGRGTVTDIEIRKCLEGY